MRVIFVALFATITAIVPHSSVAQLHCINYTSQDGLPADHVTCGIEDQDGFMWIGTSGGVCWFDGRRFVDYSNLGRGEVPGAVMVTCIAVDQDNNIWIGSDRQGIFRLDRQTNEWGRYHKDAMEHRKIISNEIRSLYSDEDGTMWYGGGPSGLSRIDLSRDTVLHYFLDAFPRRSRWPNAVYGIQPSKYDRDQLLFIAQGYVFQFDKLNKKITLLPNQDSPIGKMESEYSPHSFAQLDKGKIWLGTWINGVWQYDMAEERLEEMVPDAFSAGGDWRVNVISGSQEDVWSIHRKVGIYNYNFFTNEWNQYQAQPYNRNGLLGADYTGGYMSRDKDLWIFSTNGLSLIIPEYQSFTYYDTEVEKLNFLMDTYYNEETEEYYMAYAGDHGAFKVFDKDLHLKSSLNFNPEQGFQTIYNIKTIDNQIYLLSNDLFKYDSNKGKLSRAIFPGIEHKGRCADLLKDKLGQYWFLYRNHTLLNYDPGDHQVQKYVIPDHVNDHNNYYSYSDIAEVGANIWLAAGSELVIQSITKDRPASRFYMKDRQFIEVAEVTDIDRKTDIEQIVRVDDNCAWLLLNIEGLVKVCYDEATNQMRVVESRDKNDLPQLQSPIDMERGLHEDYWMATHNGLVHTNDSLTSYRIFNQSHGLNSTKLNQGLSISNEKLFVGMPKGFAVVDMDQILLQRPGANCKILSISLDTTNFLHQPDPVFNYDYNNLTVEVAVPIYHDARTLTYAHRLSNVNSDWVFTGSDQYIFQYDNLSPGFYTFEVKAKSESQPWSEVETVSFTIDAPFWNRNWFKILLGLSILAALYLIYKIRLKRAVEQEQVKTQLAELESIALRSQMNPHFIFNSLNSVKSLMLLDRKGESIKYLTDFSKMVREVLSISQETFITLERELSLLSLYIEMEQLRFHEKFQYRLIVDPKIDLADIEVPPLLIQPYVENAIWHGLLHKEDLAELKIEVNLLSEKILIIITDNGIGREASQSLAGQSLSFRKKHMGMHINQRRIQLMHQESKVEIEDLKHDDGSAAGTKVLIHIRI